MAMGLKTVRAQCRHFMRGQDVSDRNPEISAIPCFSVRNLLSLCVLGEICHAEAEKRCRKKELKEVQKEDARMLKMNVLKMRR